jgi:hypothetical protein
VALRAPFPTRRTCPDRCVLVSLVACLILYCFQTEFEANGGTIVHSSRHRTTPDMTGKKVIVVGAATSAHDLCGELYDNGLDVTMIQRSSSHIISVDKGVRMMYAKFEDLSKPGTLQKADRGTWLSQPYRSDVPPVVQTFLTFVFFSVSCMSSLLVFSRRLGKPTRKRSMR